MSEPRDHLRRKELGEALRARGFSGYEVKKLIQENVIKSHKFRPNGASYFVWPEVKKALQLEEKTT